MQKLHLVGFTTEHDGLIFSARKGSKAGGYLVILDPELLTTIAEAERLRNGDQDHPQGSPARPRPTSRLTPREIQAYVRSGRSIPEVAAEAGVDAEWVERFAVPVVAEQAQMVERALAMTYSKARLGQSCQPLSTSVRWNLADKGVALTDEAFEQGWSAFQLQDEVWMVRFRYTSRARLQVAEWELDLGTHQLASRNRLASELGYVEKGRRPPALPAPAPRMPTPPPPPSRVVEQVIEEPEPEVRPVPIPPAPTRRAPAPRTRRAATRRKSQGARRTSASKSVSKKSTSTPKTPAAKRSTTRRSAAKRSAAKRSTSAAKRSAATRSTTKRSTAKRPTSPARKSTAKKSTSAARKSTAKKSTSAAKTSSAKEPTAKMPTARSTPSRAKQSTSQERSARKGSVRNAPVPRARTVTNAAPRPERELDDLDLPPELDLEFELEPPPRTARAADVGPELAPDGQPETPAAQRRGRAGQPRIAASSATEAAKRSGAPRSQRPVRKPTKRAQPVSPTLSGPLARSLLARRLMARKASEGDGGRRGQRPLRVK